MHFRLNFYAFPVQSPFECVHLTHKNLSARIIMSQFTRQK